jgi:hypothetical protein
MIDTHGLGTTQAVNQSWAKRFQPTSAHSGEEQEQD